MKPLRHELVEDAERHLSAWLSRRVDARGDTLLALMERADDLASMFR